MTTFRALIHLAVSLTWHSFLANLYCFWAFCWARSVGHASARICHEVLVMDKKVQQGYCLLGQLFASPPWFLVVPSVLLTRAETR